MHIPGSLLKFFVVALALIPLTATAQSATVQADTPAYAQMSTAGGSVGTLNKGERVRVELTVTDAGGEWCFVRARAVTGYVRCTSLQRDPVPPRAVSPNSLKSPPTAQPGLADARARIADCDMMNFRDWVLRSDLSADQRSQVQKVAEETGIEDCSRKASGFNRQYRADPSQEMKMRLLRGWATVDPNDSCVVATRMFWSKVRLLMTQEQLQRMMSELPKIREKVSQVQSDPKNCSPIFCIY